MQLKKRLFNTRFFDHGSHWDQTVEKAEIFDPNLQSESCIVPMLESPAAYWYDPHNNTTHDITPYHNIGDVGLAVVTSAADRHESA